MQNVDFPVSPDKLAVPYLTDRPAEEAVATTVPASLAVARFLGPRGVGSALSATDALAMMHRYIVLVECGREEEQQVGPVHRTR